MAKLFHTNLITSSSYSCSLHLYPENVFYTYFYICLYLLCIYVYRTKVNPVKIHRLHFGCYTSLVSFNIEWATLWLNWERISLQCRRPGRIPWRRKRQPTAVLLPGEFHGQRSQAGCSPWDRRVRQDCVTNFYFFFFLYRIVPLLLFIHDTKWLYFKRMEVSCWVILTF